MFFFCFYPVWPVSIFCYIDFNPLLKHVNRNFFSSTCMQCHCYKQVFPVGCVQNKRIWVWSYKMNYCNKATVRRWLPHSQQQQSYFGLRSLQLRQQPVILQWRHRWFPHEMTSTDNASLPRSGQCFWLVEANFPSWHDQWEALNRSG